jgi:uncharacterized protein (DUF2141 family)
MDEGTEADRMTVTMLALLGPAASAATLRVEIDGLRNDVGVIQLALFQTEEGYPRHTERAARTATVTANATGVGAVFDDLPAGTWALAVLHDENANGRLDTNLLGVPLEGIGASRDATRRMGEPRFEDARFELRTAEDVTVEVQLRYYL